MRKIILLLGVAAVVGCASMDKSDFYGVKIDQMSEDSSFLISGVNGKEVEHTSTKTMSTEVTAWGEIKGTKVLITVVNASGQPLKTDYFFDKFTVMTKKKEEYQLKKESETLYSYRAGENIDSGNKALYVLTSPQAFEKDDIEKIVCQLGLLSGARIVLKPLP